MVNFTTDLESGTSSGQQRPQVPLSPRPNSIPSTIWTDRLYFIIVVIILAGFVVALVVVINAWALKDKRDHPDENFEKETVVVARHMFKRYWRTV
ncbi:hypothetical protein N431DRAFT_2145 [Stipitochalara longipes BDJ]|nr:hypothetical protein N431DRAFT_2145 [Stipitochalara longipes BDJ]